MKMSGLYWGEAFLFANKQQTGILRSVNSSTGLLLIFQELGLFFISPHPPTPPPPKYCELEHCVTF